MNNPSQSSPGSTDTLPYSGIRIVEIAGDLSGELTSQLLCDLGAECVKVEPPEGAPSRRIGPFAKDQPSPETSLTFWYYNTGKRSVVADLCTPQGNATLSKLLESADILICTLTPKAMKAADLDYSRLRAAYPRLIILSVTPFGLEGPWADLATSDLVSLALGGPLNSCGYDDHAIPPIRPGINQSHHTAASFAHSAAALALIEREQSGEGDLIDVSMHEALTVTVELANPYWFYPRVHVQRQTCRHAQPVRTQSALFQCSDGYVYSAFILAEQRAWTNIIEWMESKDLAADLSEERFREVAYRQKNFNHVQEIMECFFLMMTTAEAYHEGQARGLPIGRLNAPEDLFEDEHLKARGFFVPVQHEGVGEFLYPGATSRFTAFEAPALKRAPKLGEHTLNPWGESFSPTDSSGNSAAVDSFKEGEHA